MMSWKRTLIKYHVTRYVYIFMVMHDLCINMLQLCLSIILDIDLKGSIVMIESSSFISK